MTEVLPSDEGRAQHLQVTVFSTQILSKCHLKAGVVLELVKSTLRHLQYIQRGIYIYHKTSTCGCFFLLLRQLGASNSF